MRVGGEGGQQQRRERARHAGESVNARSSPAVARAGGVGRGGRHRGAATARASFSQGLQLWFEVSNWA